MGLKNFCSKVNLVLLNVFVWLIIWDPGNISGLKSIIYLLVVILNCKVLLKEIKYCFCVMMIIVYYQCIGMIDKNYKNLSTALTIIQPMLMLFLVPIMKKYFYLISKAIVKSGLALSYYSVISYIGLNFFSLKSTYFETLVSGNNLMISRRKYGNYIINVFYYKTISASIFTYYYYLNQILIKKNKIKDIFNVIIIYLSFLFSTARANFIFSLVGISFFRKKISKKGIIPYLTVVCIFLLIIFNLEKVIEILIGLFDKKEQSNQVKINYLQDYLEVFNSLKVIILGQGLGTVFFSHSKKEWLRYTELSYLEIFRLFGIPFTLIIIITLIYKIKDRRIKLDNPIVASFVIFLLIGGTNPLLINSTGSFILSYFIAYLQTKKNQNDSKNKKEET